MCSPDSCYELTEPNLVLTTPNRELMKIPGKRH